MIVMIVEIIATSTGGTAPAARVHVFGTLALNKARAPAKHVGQSRVQENAQAVQFNDQGGVSQPGGPQFITAAAEKRIRIDRL